MNPYKIDGPAAISFSGGRTSGYMLAKIVEAHGGTLPPDVIPIFANTGKEHEKTLEFVQQCSERLAPVIWIEYAGTKTFKTVNFETASRSGEPFAMRIAEKNFLPNTFARYCTIDLKIDPQHKYLKSLGWKEWTVCVGLRADEPRRVASFTGNTKYKHIESICPLSTAGVQKRDIADFWEGQCWGLDLPILPDGTTYFGNCDLCFLKGTKKRIALIMAEPQRSVWWAEQEKMTNHQFQKHQPSYLQLAMLATQPALNFESEDIADCACTD